MGNLNLQTTNFDNSIETAFRNNVDQLIRDYYPYDLSAFHTSIEALHRKAQELRSMSEEELNQIINRNTQALRRGDNVDYMVASMQFERAIAEYILRVRQISRSIENFKLDE